MIEQAILPPGKEGANGQGSGISSGFDSDAAAAGADAGGRGGPLRRRNLLRRWFHPLVARAGLPRMRFHDPRHAHASLLLAAGVHPKVVQERLGHSQVSVTLDTYSHVAPSLQREAAERLDGLLEGRPRRGGAG